MAGIAGAGTEELTNLLCILLLADPPVSVLSGISQTSANEATAICGYTAYIPKRETCGMSRPGVPEEPERFPNMCHVLSADMGRAEGDINKK